MPPSRMPLSEPHDRLIDADQVAHRLRISKRTLYRRLDRKRIPQPVERRRGVVAKWRESDIDAFIARLPADSW
jgi:predicted DNA-binding transcriptional regulator AlpA